MDKIKSFILKVITVISIIGAAIVAFILFFKRDKSYIKKPNKDIPKEKAIIDKEVLDAKDEIDKDIKAKLDELNSKTDLEIKNNLSDEANKKIDDVKKKTTDSIVDAIMNDLT